MQIELLIDEVNIIATQQETDSSKMCTPWPRSAAFNSSNEMGAGAKTAFSLLDEATVVAGPAVQPT